MGERTLWLDCSNGVAGDMLVAALLGAGGDQSALERALSSLPLEGYDVRVRPVEKSGIRCLDFEVVLEPELETHDHDMDRLYGDLDEESFECELRDERDGDGCPDDHVHRGLGDVLELIEAADLSDGARSFAQRTFFILADAEAEAHGKTRASVVFHEIGAIDSIVDVVAASVLLDSLNLKRVCVTALTEGSGRIRTAHGVMPIPVPAVASILRSYEIPVRFSSKLGELVTPTGIALVAACATSFEAPKSLVITASGYGAGKRDYAWPNYVRAILGYETHTQVSEDARSALDASERIVKLECEVDDMTGEAMGTVISRLMALGAREAHWIALGGKKGRPAWQLQVLTTQRDREALELAIFRDTTTIGIRRVTMERTVLPREEIRLEAELASGVVCAFLAKRVRLPDGSVRVMPEFDDVTRISKEQRLSLQHVWQATLAACRDLSLAPQSAKDS